MKHKVFKSYKLFSNDPRLNMRKSTFIHVRGHDYDIFKHPAIISEAEDHAVFLSEINKTW